MLIVQIVGALVILAAFVLAQLRVLDARSRTYLVPNLVGAAALAADAYVGREWGFLVLESAWAVVSAAGLLTSRGLEVEPLEEEG